MLFDPYWKEITIITTDLESGDFSSDDDDEGFENPMDDNDDDDLEDEDDTIDKSLL